MRQTILAASIDGRGTVVLGTLGATPTLLADRVANGHAFPGERLVRLPRRLSRDRRFGRGW